MRPHRKRHESTRRIRSSTLRGLCALTTAATLFLCGAASLAGCGAAGPTVEEASAFMDEVETERRRLLALRERAGYVRATNITYDTEQIAAETSVAMMEFMAGAIRRVKRFNDLVLDGVLARKMRLLRTSQTLPAPDDREQRERLAALSTQMSGMYGKGKYCPNGPDGECLTLGALARVMAESRDPAVLLDTWRGWRSVSVPMRPLYGEFVGLANAGARELGFDDLGAMWRSKYDMTPQELTAEVDRLWQQVRPLYEQLHCYTRARLSDHYGADVVAPTGAMPAHLLGNMWAQDWAYLSWLLIPEELRQGDGTSPVTAALTAKGVDEREMVRYAERFFVSLGLQKLPETFWERSLFVKPRDREVECHASAWPVDWYSDVRIKMCIEIHEEDFVTIHHELGHLYFYLAYKDQSALFTESPHDGFHEALGDTIALSVTPAYLKQIGLVEDAGGNEIEALLRRALERVAFLPFGIVVDKWRWQVFSGELGPDSYNAGWWKLRADYQGVRPPIERSEADFDPGSKFHIAGTMPYMRYFLAHILQFQLHRGLCKLAGHTGRLHECTIYGNKDAGARLQSMMALGMSRPWPDALELVIGERQMDGTALLDYFAPLLEWLRVQNQGRTCGW